MIVYLIYHLYERKADKCEAGWEMAWEAEGLKLAVLQAAEQEPQRIWQEGGWPWLLCENQPHTPCTFGPHQGAQCLHGGVQ